MLQNSAAKAKEPYEALIELDELHIKYEEELKQAEFALEGIEDSPVEVPAEVVEKTDNDVSSKLQEALEGELDSLNLSGQFLIHLPEPFGRITSLVSLNLSYNSLEVRATKSLWFSWHFFPSEKRMLLWALPTLYSFMAVRYNCELPHSSSNCESLRESQGSLSFQVSEFHCHEMQ